MSFRFSKPIRSRSISAQWFPAIAAVTFFSIPLAAQSTATVSATLNPSAARATAIPTDFEGMSLPMGTISSSYNSSGKNWLNGTPYAYSKMLETIGVKSMRVGGTSSEESTYPTDSDANAANDFAQLTGINLIWTLPVGPNYNLATYTTYAKNMLANKASKKQTFSTTFEIGNEFEHYISYSTYQTRFDAYNAALRSQVTTTGPSSAGNVTYSNDLSNDSTYHGSLHSSIGFITTHQYPGGLADHITSISQADNNLLGSGVTANYQSLTAAFQTDPINNGFIPRYEESNSISEGGYAGASDAYAAALWGVDWLCYNAYNTSIAGINFHIGGGTPYNAINPQGYATSYTLEPLGYGMLAFFKNGQGRPIPVSLSNPNSANVSAYALLEANNNIAMHIVNRSYGSSATDVTANINPGNGAGHAQIMYLKQTDSDVTAKSGITVGGQPVNSDGSWTGNYTVVITPKSGVFSISVPHAQVAVVHFF